MIEGQDKRTQIRFIQPARNLASENAAFWTAFPGDDQNTAIVTRARFMQKPDQGLMGFYLRHAMQIDGSIDGSRSLSQLPARAAIQTPSVQQFRQSHRGGRLRGPIRFFFRGEGPRHSAFFLRVTERGYLRQKRRCKRADFPCDCFPERQILGL